MKNMLKHIKIESSSIYEVRVESGDLFIGQFIMSDDGFYYFSPISSDGCLWSDYTLIDIGIKLKELNQPWAYQIKKL